MKMNKKVLALILAVGIMAGSQAMASRARLLVLGTGDAGMLLDGNGNGGSFIVDDAYNMFYNPAFINNYKDWATIEKSNGVNSAEGGFVTSVMNFNLGVFMNRTSALDANWTNRNNMRPIDVIFGGDSGIKWGVGLTYATYHATDKTDTNLDLKAGVEVNNFEPFIAYKVIGGEKQAVNQKHKDMAVGTRYHYGEWTPYAAVRMAKLEDVKTNSWGLGAGRKSKVAEGVKLDYGFGFFRQTHAGLAHNVVPIDLAVEGEILSWMTVRGGVSYNFWDRDNNTTVADNTAASLGASFHVGKFNMDWAVGSAASLTPAGEKINGATFDASNGFFTAASVTYTW